MLKERLLIIGSGAAGWTAALYAARAGLSPLVVAGPQPGGQLTITSEVENYPGFPEPVGGPELMMQMEEQALRYGARVVSDEIVSVDFSGEDRIVRGQDREWAADGVVIATGARARRLGVEGEDRYFGRGYSNCAVCDSFAVRGKEAVVVGGGNTAVEEALYLSGICSTVHLVHRGTAFRAEKVLQERLAVRENVRPLMNTRVRRIFGDEKPIGGVTGIELEPVGGGDPFPLYASGVFGAVGHDPASAPFADHVACDPAGYIVVTPGTTRTSVERVWAAGDVADPHWRQAVTAAGMGCQSALDAERTLGSVR